MFSSFQMNRIYRVELDGELLGETRLENADPPMGVVSGKVIFSTDECPYLLFRRYCAVHGIAVNQDDEEHALIDTQRIDGLKVLRWDGVGIEGGGGTVGGVGPATPGEE